ncbi:MAG: T9SS type A sorting domain-containing protein [Cytophagales bacterium]|nr:T9SS type A sorting domain-containing protein [Cytophagales bacterium]
MKKIYTLSLISILFSSQLNGQQTAQEYLNTFKASANPPNFVLKGDPIPSGKSLRVVFSKNAPLSGNDQVTDGLGHTNIAGGLYTGSSSSIFALIEDVGFGAEGIVPVGSGFEAAEEGPGNLLITGGDVVYIYLTLYNSADGTGTGTTREIQITIPSANTGTAPEAPKFYISRIAGAESGVQNVELIAHSGIDEHTRFFFSGHALEGPDATVVADALDPNSDLYSEPDVVYDETGGAKIYAELSAGTHYFYATHRNGNGYNTQTITLEVPSSGLASAELQKLKPQFAISETGSTTLGLLRKGPVFTESIADATKVTFQGYRILYGTTSLSGFSDGNTLEHELADQANPPSPPTGFQHIDILKASTPEETGKSPVGITGLSANTKYYIYVIALAGEGIGVVQALEVTTRQLPLVKVDKDIYVSNLTQNSFEIHGPTIKEAEKYEILVISSEHDQTSLGQDLSAVWDLASPGTSGFYKYWESAPDDLLIAITVQDTDLSRSLYHVFIRVRDTRTGALIGGPYQLDVRLNKSATIVPTQLAGEEAYEAEKTHNSITVGRELQIPAGEAHYFYLTETALSSFDAEFVVDGASDHNTLGGTGYRSELFSSREGSDFSVEFDNLDPETDYHIYLIAREGKADHTGRAIAFQYLQVQTDPIPAPDPPDFEKTASLRGGFTLSQTGNVPDDETYVVIVSETSIVTVASKVSDTAVVSGLGADQVSRTLSTGSPARVTIRGLNSDTEYYVYVVAVKAGFALEIQDFTARTGVIDLPSFVQDAVSEDAITLHQDRNGDSRVDDIASDETYFVIVSKTEISDPTSKLNEARDAVIDLAEDESEKSLTLSGGSPARATFTGLTPSTPYYAYVVALRSNVADIVVQTLDPKPRTGDVPLPGTPKFLRTARTDGGFTLSQVGHTVPSDETYYVIVSKTDISTQLISPEAVQDAARDISDDSDAKSVTLAGDASATATFTGLTAITSYNVYVVAINRGSIPTIQTFAARTGTTLPEAPDFERTAITAGGFTLSQDKDADGSTDNIPSDETYYVFVSKTDIASQLSGLEAVRDVARDVTDDANAKSLTLAGDASASGVFTGLTPEFNYYVYVVAGKGEERTIQDFRAKAGADPPVRPGFVRSAITNGGFTLSQLNHKVPSDETYHVFVSKTDIASQLSGLDVIRDLARDLSDDENAKSVTVAGGAVATATFTGLTAGTDYHVYVAALKAEADPTVQVFQARTGVAASPELPAYRVSSIREGLQFVQVGNVPAGETYYVIVSNSAISNTADSVVDGAFEGLGTDRSLQQSKKIAAGTARSLAFEGLLGGTEYYVYALSVKGDEKEAQTFHPEKYTAGLSGLPEFPDFEKDATDTTPGGLTLKGKGVVPDGDTYYLILSKTEIASVESSVVDASVRGLGTDRSLQQSKALLGNSNRKVAFTGLIPSTAYHIYVVAVNSAGTVFQYLKAGSGALPLPEVPKLKRDASDTASGSLSLLQDGLVPEDESYFVIVSETEITNVKSKVVSASVSGLSAGQQYRKIAQNTSRRAVFTGLTPATEYHVYVIAVNRSGAVVQTLKAIAGGSSVPKAPGYKISALIGGLRFTQTGNVPAGETYYLIVSQKAIIGLKSKLKTDKVDGIGNDAKGKFVIIEASKARTVDFTDLTPKTSYYVYAVAVKGKQVVSQGFRPASYVTGSEEKISFAQQLDTRSVIYPNPSRDWVYISNAKAGDLLRVYTASGLYLDAYPLSARGSLDLSALNAGIYIIELNGIRHRVIIE